jgi:hypothetical protein
MKLETAIAFVLGLSAIAVEDHLPLVEIEVIFS